MGCVFLSKKKGPCISGLIEPECCPHTSARCLRSIYYTHLSSRATPCRFALFGPPAPVASRFVFTSARIDRPLFSSHARRTITYHFPLIRPASHRALPSSRVLPSLILPSSYYETGFSSSFRPTFRDINGTDSSSRYVKIKIDRCARKSNTDMS